MATCGICGSQIGFESSTKVRLGSGESVCRRCFGRYANVLKPPPSKNPTKSEFDALVANGDLPPSLSVTPPPKISAAAKLFIAGLAVAFFIWVALQSDQSEPKQDGGAAGVALLAPTPVERVEALVVSVIDEAVQDNPGRSAVIRKVVVKSPPHSVSRESLDKYLRESLGEIMGRRGWTYESKTKIGSIIVFMSKESVESDQWIAMIRKTPNEDEPNLSFDEAQLAGLAGPTAEKNGLDETTRRNIFQDMYQASVEARKSAEKKFPAMLGPGPFDQTTLQGFGEFRDSEEKRLKFEVAKKYGISEESAEAIALEGLQSGWSEPTD